MRLTTTEVRARMLVACLLLAVVFWTWALIAMLLGQAQMDEETLAIIGLGWAVLSCGR